MRSLYVLPSPCLRFAFAAQTDHLAARAVGSETPQRRTQCDGGQPCQACEQSGRDCTDGRDEQRQSAWANVKSERIQRWAEPVQLVLGIEGGVRLQPKRDAAGRLAAFERQALVRRNQGGLSSCPTPGEAFDTHTAVSSSDLRLVSSTPKARLCFPATISTENEVEEMDLLGDPVQMEADGPLLQALVRCVCTLVSCDTKG